jgi:hypothetical protein
MASCGGIVFNVSFIIFASLLFRKSISKATLQNSKAVLWIGIVSMPIRIQVEFPG